MSDRAEDSGPAVTLVRQATDGADKVASWLESREPGDLLDEVRRFARQRPGTFLAAAAAAGAVAGRLTRNAVASAGGDTTPANGVSDSTPGSRPPADASGYARPPMATPTVPPPAAPGSVGPGSSPSGPPATGPSVTPTGPGGTYETGPVS